MKKQIKILAVLVIVLLSSCTDSTVDKKSKEHYIRMLDVEYLRAINDMKSDAELKLFVHHCDSILNAYNYR